MSDVGVLRELYHDLQEIDRQREGTRYTATTADGAPVVVLAISPEIGARIRSPERFTTALQRAATVRHEAVIPPIAQGVAGDGTLHCAYARVERQDVTPGTLAPTTVASIGVQIARALSTIHGARLVHGSITTARILLTPDHGPKLNEFGLFAALNEGGLGNQATSALLGEPGFASPEVQSGNDPDARSDVYSLGASLYELLTGKPPYGGRTTSYVLASVLSDTSAEGGADSSELANPVVDAIMRAIERAPEDRWPDAAAFAAALAVSSGIQEAGAPEKAASRRGCLPAATAVAVALALIVGIVGQ